MRKIEIAVRFTFEKPEEIDEDPKGFVAFALPDGSVHTFAFHLTQEKIMTITKDNKEVMRLVWGQFDEESLKNFTAQQQKFLGVFAASLDNAAEAAFYNMWDNAEPFEFDIEESDTDFEDKQTFEEIIIAIRGSEISKIIKKRRKK